MNIIEELWYGKINPSEELGKGEEYHQLQNQLIIDERDLKKLLSKNALKAFEQYDSTNAALSSQMSRDAFELGFNLAASIFVKLTDNDLCL